MDLFQRWVGMVCVGGGESIDSCCSGATAMFHLKMPSLNLSFSYPQRIHIHTHTHTHSGNPYARSPRSL